MRVFAVDASVVPIMKYGNKVIVGGGTVGGSSVFMAPRVFDAEPRPDVDVTLPSLRLYVDEFSGVVMTPSGCSNIEHDGGTWCISRESILYSSRYVPRGIIYAAWGEDGLVPIDVSEVEKVEALYLVIEANGDDVNLSVFPFGDREIGVETLASGEGHIAKIVGMDNGSMIVVAYRIGDAPARHEVVSVEVKNGEVIFTKGVCAKPRCASYVEIGREHFVRVEREVEKRLF